MLRAVSRRGAWPLVATRRWLEPALGRSVAPVLANGVCTETVTERQPRRQPILTKLGPDATPLELAKFLVGDGVNVDESSVLFEGYIDNETSTQVAKYFGGATIFDSNEDMNEGVDKENEILETRGAMLTTEADELDGNFSN